MPISRRQRTRLRTDSPRDRQILALHVAAVEKLIADPSLANKALEKLERRYAAGLIKHSVYIGWFSILDLLIHHQVESFKLAVIADNAYMRRLRRKSPMIALDCDN